MIVPGHRADVGAAVAADLGLVAHAADAMRTNLRPSARAIECPSDVLPTPGGPTKQRIEVPPRVGLELAHRQVLEDALLDLLEAEVVVVEHLARVREVEVVFGRMLHGSEAIHSR